MCRRDLAFQKVNQVPQPTPGASSPSLPTCSQNFLSRHTLPTPARSSHFLTPSLLSRTSPRQTAPTHRRRPSLSFSFSTARFLAMRPGATLLSTTSGGSTPRCTRDSAEGRSGKLRDSRIDTRLRASRREICVVWVKKMWREMSSVRVGREGEVKRGGSDRRARRRRRVCKIGCKDRVLK